MFVDFLSFFLKADVNEDLVSLVSTFVMIDNGDICQSMACWTKHISSFF